MSEFAAGLAARGIAVARFEFPPTCTPGAPAAGAARPTASRC
jgi:predicted alpha/beta-hydrolase family hydrolase